MAITAKQGEHLMNLGFLIMWWGNVVFGVHGHGRYRVSDMFFQLSQLLFQLYLLTFRDRRYHLEGLSLL